MPSLDLKVIATWPPNKSLNAFKNYQGLASQPFLALLDQKRQWISSLAHVIYSWARSQTNQPEALGIQESFLSFQEHNSQLWSHLAFRSKDLSSPFKHWKLVIILKMVLNFWTYTKCVVIGHVSWFLPLIFVWNLNLAFSSFVASGITGAVITLCLILMVSRKQNVLEIVEPSRHFSNPWQTSRSAHYCFCWSWAERPSRNCTQLKATSFKNHTFNKDPRKLNFKMIFSKQMLSSLKQYLKAWCDTDATEL